MHISVSEVHSPPRVTKAATMLPKLGLLEGWHWTSPPPMMQAIHVTSVILSNEDVQLSCSTSRSLTCLWAAQSARHSAHGRG